MNEENPSYYAIIPANVRYANITPNSKLLYGEITSLSNKLGFCYASNNYFANLYGVSKVSISKWIKELVDNGFLTSYFVYKDGSKQILNRYLRIVIHPIKENFNTPIKENFKDNNTSNNNKYNNKYNFISEKNVFSLYSEEKCKEEFRCFWSYYPKQRAGGKAQAFVEYCRIVNSKEATFEELYEGVKRYDNSTDIIDNCAMNCVKWLKDGNWENEYD